MKNHFDASPFAAGFSSAVIDRLAQAQAIISLSAQVDSDAVADLTRRTGHKAALSIVKLAVSGITFGAGEATLAREIIATVNDSLAQAQALIDILAHCKSDSTTSDELDLVSSAANGFLQIAMETLENGAAE